MSFDVSSRDLITFPHRVSPTVPDSRHHREHRALLIGATVQPGSADGGGPTSGDRLPPSQGNHFRIALAR
jgi:hypothetical protein